MESSTPVIVAIDGPSGTGKSSTSKAVAAQLGLSYLDTGAQYRAITWWMVINGIDTADPSAIAAAAGKPEILSGTDPEKPTSARGAEVGRRIGVGLMYGLLEAARAGCLAGARDRAGAPRHRTTPTTSTVRWSWEWHPGPRTS
ncbi:Bifunctional pantoate ligase/cytidylate kinase [Streptomyces hirsutus]